MTYDDQTHIMRQAQAMKRGAGPIPPETPRERLVKAVEAARLSATPGGAVYALIGAFNVLLDSGLLDQANEGRGPKLESRADLRPSGGREQDVSGDPAGEKEGLAATVPHPPSPAPASVEGVVLNRNPYGQLCIVTSDCNLRWPEHAKVRVTPLDPEAT